MFQKYRGCGCGCHENINYVDTRIKHRTCVRAVTSPFGTASNSVVVLQNLIFHFTNFDEPFMLIRFDLIEHTY